MSRTFSTNCASVASLNVSARCGLSHVVKRELAQREVTPLRSAP
jgi:hypothetical protein